MLIYNRMWEFDFKEHDCHAISLICMSAHHAGDPGRVAHPGTGLWLLSKFQAELQISRSHLSLYSDVS